MENLNSMNALKTLIKEFYIESGDTKHKFYELYTSDIDTDIDKIEDRFHIGDTIYSVNINKYPTLNMVTFDVHYLWFNPYGLNKQWRGVLGIDIDYGKGTYKIHVNESEYYQKEYVLPFLAKIDRAYISDLIEKNLKKNVDKMD